MSKELFGAALGFEMPWYVRGITFETDKRILTIGIDFKKGSAFYEGTQGLHRFTIPDKRYRHLNFFSMSVFSRCARQGSRFQMAG